MNFNDILTRVCNRLNKNVNDSAVTTRIKNWINETSQENWDGFTWSFRYREYLLPEVADLVSPTSGTVTCTAGSQTVTADAPSAPFIVGTHVGAYIRFTSDAVSMFYRVVNVVNSSTLTIEPSYQGVTGASKSYELRKLDWLFPSELVDATLVQIPIYTGALPIYSNIAPPDVNRGIPQAAYLYSQDFIGATYSTGSVSGSANSNVLVGVNTLWLSNVTAGDTITITGDSGTIGALSNVLTRYTVYKVVSDTSIILCQNLLVAASGASYTSTRQYGRYLRLMPSPTQGWGVLVGGYRRYAQLINGNDTNELTLRYPNAIIEGAIYREQGASPDNREGGQYQVQKSTWESAKADDRSMTKRHVSAPIFSNRRPR